MSLTKVSYSMIQGSPVNILDYGASTSSANNTVAIQAAIDTGLDVYIPPGEFICTDTLSMSTPYQTLFGNGEGSQITFTFASSKIGLIAGKPTNIATDKQTIRNLYLLGTANVSKLISVQGPELRILENTIRNSSANGTCIDLEDEDIPTNTYCFTATIQNNIILATRTAGTKGIRLGQYHQGTNIQFNQILDAAILIYINGATTITNITQNVIEGSVVNNAAIIITRGGTTEFWNIHIENNYFEEHQYVISLNAGWFENLNITGNYSNRNNTVGPRGGSHFFVNTAAAAFAGSQNIIINNNRIEDFETVFGLNDEYSSRLTSVSGNITSNCTNYSAGTYENNAYKIRPFNSFFTKRNVSGSYLSENQQRIESKDAVFTLPIDFEPYELMKQIDFVYANTGGTGVTVRFYKSTSNGVTATQLGTVTTSTAGTSSIVVDNYRAEPNYNYYLTVTFDNTGTSGYVYPFQLYLYE